MGDSGIAVAAVFDVRTLGTRHQRWLFQEAFGAVTAEVELQIAASQVPAALAATGTCCFSGTHGCVCFVIYAGKLWHYKLACVAVSAD